MLLTSSSPADPGSCKNNWHTNADIPTRKRAEAALGEREQQLRTMLQTTHEAFYPVDMQEKLLI
jgi:hypothetical protein